MPCCNNQNDDCACRPCTYPNGAVVLILSQIMLFIGWILSGAVLFDCEFVTVDASSVDPFLTSIFPNNGTNSTAGGDNNNKRGLGFLFFEGSDGKCDWERNHTESSFQEYFDFLGSGWNQPRDLASSASTFAFIFWIWALVFSCVAHLKVLRYIFAALVTIMLTIFQAVPFTVLNSDFCNENDCQIGRTAKYAMAATPLFFVSGVLLFCTKDYPGHQRAATLPVATGVAAQKTSTAVDDAHTVEHDAADEEAANRQNQGFGEAQEVPVESEMVDVSLVDSKATTTKATIY